MGSTRHRFRSVYGTPQRANSDISAGHVADRPYFGRDWSTDRVSPPGGTIRRKLMPQLKLMLPEQPGESSLDTIPFILGGVDCLLSVMEIAGVMELSIALGVVTGPLAAAAGSFMALGAGYDEAKRDITWRELSRGFSLGVVMAADGVSPKKGAAYFGHRYFARNLYL